MNKQDLPRKGTITQEQRVALYVRIITENILSKHILTEYNVALMRNKAPSAAELSALNTALAQLGWAK